MISILRRYNAQFIFGIVFVACLIAPSAHAKTFTVDEANDPAVDASCAADEDNADATCSLREAISAANSDTSEDHTIAMPSGTITLAIANASGDEDANATGDLDITNTSVTIALQGVGEGSTIIDGADLDRVLEIKTGTAVAIDDLTMRNGAISGTLYCGAIVRSDFATVTMTNVTLSDGENTENICGGGAAYFNTSTVVLDNVLMSNNAATELVSGGAIYSYESDLTITGGSEITSNTVAGNGGAIYINGIDTGDVIIEDTIISNNNAAANGGGIMYAGGASLVLRNGVVVSGNTATSGGGLQLAKNTTVTDTVISDNTANTYGGGLLASTASVTLEDVVISGNIAISGGGFRLSGATAILNISNSLISGNTASGGGGGGYVGAAAIIEVNNSTFSGNEGSSGGGVYAIGSSAMATFFATTITENNGTSGTGGLYQGSGSTITVTQSIVANNTTNGVSSVDCSGTITSGDYNLIEDTTACTIGGTTTHNITGSDPGLAALADNGGSTQTHAFVNPAASPAVNVVPADVCLANIGEGPTDQINQERLGHCDIGSFEYQDVTAPTISLVGGNTSVECTEIYSDAGATATDDIDGDLTVDISVINPVDVDTVGEYTVTYDVSDLSLNDAIQAVRTVAVEDTVAPTISINGGEVSLNEGSGYTDLGASAADSCDADVIVTVNNPVDIDQPDIYIVTYTAIDSAGNEATATRTVTVVDTTAPSVSLLGNSSVTHEAGGSYTDAGATATDAVDGNLTSSIVVSGSVDTSTPGTYTLTYTVTDEAGNSASVTRTVTVVDTTAPVLTLSGDSEIFINKGDVYEDAGATATDAVDGNLTSSIVVSGSVDTSTPGTYTLTYTVTDEAGNSASVTRTVTVVAYGEIVSKSKEGGVLTLTFANGATVAIEPYNGKKNFRAALSTDGTRLIVTNGKTVKVYIDGEQVAQKKIAKKTVKRKYYILKVGKVYDGKSYDTITVLSARKKTKTAVDVLRLTSAGNLKKHKEKNITTAKKGVVQIKYKSNKKRIVLTAGTKKKSSKASYKLTKKGKLKLVE